MIKIPLIICLIIIMLQSVTATSLHRHKSPAMTESWSEIEMVYYRYFPNAGIHHYKSAGECTLLYKRIKKDALKMPDVLRCTEHIKLLMPTSAINTWKQKKKKQQSYINLNNSEKAENHKNTTDTRIVSIRPITVNSQNPFTSKGTNMVTGLFVQHAISVRKYTFKEVTTGKISTINATTNHPFYVRNRSTFIPIETVTDSDNLITETGQSVRLICSENRKDHCGIPYGDGQPQPVYNLQIAHRHTYFVGKKHKILVHNCTEAKVPIEKLRKMHDRPPNPKLVPYQNGSNCSSIAICAALQEARYWYNVPDNVIRENYKSYLQHGQGLTLSNSEKVLNKTGMKTELFSKINGRLLGRKFTANLNDYSLVYSLRRTRTELALVTYKDEHIHHMYMVMKSDDSPTGYLELNMHSKFSRKKMKYGVLPVNKNYAGFVKIFPR